MPYLFLIHLLFVAVLLSHLQLTLVVWRAQVEIQGALFCNVLFE